MGCTRAGGFPVIAGLATVSFCLRAAGWAESEPSGPARNGICTALCISGVSEHIAVGRGGVVWLLSNRYERAQPFERLTLPFGVDLHGVAFELGYRPGRRAHRDAQSRQPRPWDTNLP